MEATNSTNRVNGLRYTTEKTYTEDGTTYRMEVKISLADDCKNGCCKFSITADIYEQRKNGRFVWYASGCQHEEILRRFPQFRQFVNLHLSDCHGAPTYAVENGFYTMHKGKGEEKDRKDRAREYLRITDEEAGKLYRASDEKYFKYLLFSLGIVERWQKEANEAIAELERLTGCKWVNPYTPDEERFRLDPLTEEETREIKNRIAAGYYSPEAIAAREEEARRAKIQKKRAEIIANCEKKVKRLELQKNVMLYILDAGMLLDNVIYYDFENKVVFNWSDSWEKVSQADFIDFINSVDYSKLPEGIEFEIK